LGHPNVAVLNGGYDAWQNAALPTDNQWPAPQRGNFQFTLTEDLIVQKEYVHDTEDVLVDSRAYERYTGEKEPLDPIAGHIAGASCLPFTQNLHPDGYWLDKENLLTRFQGAGLSGVEKPIFYCGSGVTACHNILAFKVATGRLARLYPGSWSEWINYYPATTGE
jgi:thiosulfate/3-mercaptopyruvate sulfurtransferase